ncbi:MAG: helix-turn-helix transcriptional regulator [Planctomycetes bacterium]|nr:helix-turn-helix transcriptional regulator [Planctomycetota bacterium]
MDWPGCANLRAVRRHLGKSQSELAAMLGVSVRAVQSYEQGWRHPPATVQKLAALMCHLAWRKDHGPVKPCWEVRGCEPAVRDGCTVYQLSAGDLCWMFERRHLKGGQGAACADRDCAKCPVTRCWMPADA